MSGASRRENSAVLAFTDIENFLFDFYHHDIVGFL